MNFCTSEIGDLCRFGQYLGVVEEISLRTTRIRTSDRTVIYIANEKFIEMEIENFSERERIAFRSKIYLTPTCTTTNVDVYLNEINQLNLTILSLLEQHHCQLPVASGER